METCKLKQFVLITQVDLIKSHSHTFHGSSTTTGDSSTTNTAGMSEHASGGWRQPGLKPYGDTTVEGCVSRHYLSSGVGQQTTGGGDSCGFWIDVSHVHNMQHTHILTPNGYNDSTGGVENRPLNYTIKVWRRIN